MQLNVQISQETAEKLLYIQQQTDRDRAEILQIAVAEYYNNLIRHNNSLKQNKKTSFDFLESSSLVRTNEKSDRQADIAIDDWSDFIGSVTAEPDLAENHKIYLRTELEKKYDHC